MIVRGNRIIYTEEDSKKRILSALIEEIWGHIFYASDWALKDYMTWCYDRLYRNKEGILHKSRKKERDYILKQEGEELKNCIIERYQRGFEGHVVGGKRTLERFVSTKVIPKKRKHR